MTEELNISEILKGKSKGTKLYSPIFGDCTFSFIQGVTDAICVIANDNREFFDYKGLYSPTGERQLFPSKKMRNWSKFTWKKGDVLISNDGKVKVIFEKFRSDTYQSFIGKHHLDSLDDKNLHYQDEGEYPTFNFSLESEDAAQTYINTIERHLGGKLNRETLEIEKTQPEFKDGDIAFADFGKIQDIFIVSGKTNLSEGYYSFIALNLNSTKALSIGCKTSFFKKNLNTLRLATEEEKQQLFDALAEEGKAWNVEKKMIVDLKQKVELKPFDKVLVRDNEDDIWEVSLFGYKDELYYRCDNGIPWIQCIPYDGNEHLLGTTNNVEG